MTPPLRFVFSGGGTGGHLAPALAVCEELAERIGDEVFEAVFLTPGRPADRRFLDGRPVRHRVIAAPRLDQGLAGMLAAPWRAGRALAGALSEVSDAAAVLGMGGYSSAPGVVAAAILGVPVALLEPNQVAGRANRALARWADRVYAPEGVEGFRPGLGISRCGCPVRRGMRAPARKAEARAALGLPGEAPVLLVMGGSQGSSALNAAAEAWAPGLAASGVRLVLLGGEGVTGSRALEAAGVEARVFPFSHEVDRLLDAADLVVSRAGASALAEIAVRGRPAVLIPLPQSADNHQAANARAAEKAGWARVVPQERLLKEGWSVALEILSDPALRASMARLAESASRADAAARVADGLIDMARDSSGREMVRSDGRTAGKTLLEEVR